MNLSFYNFRAQPAMTAAALIAITLLSALGVWQVDRAAQKRALGELLETRSAMTALNLNESTVASEEMLYRTATARGRYLADKMVLIENRKYRGKSGFHVILPLELTGAQRYVLVNRGWIISPDAIVVPDGEVEVRGEIRYPSPPALELEFPLERAAETPHWPYLTLPRYQQWSGLAIAPIWLLESGAGDGAYAREWPPITINPQMHEGYALQWFAFAIIVLVIWIRLSTTRAEE